MLSKARGQYSEAENRPLLLSGLGSSVLRLRYHRSMI
jgi:hypothetical protein